MGLDIVLVVLWTCNFARGGMWIQSPDKGSQTNFNVLSSSSIRMLEEMGIKVTRQLYNPEFLNKLYAHATGLQAEEHVMFIHEVINGIQNVYISGKYDSVTWDPIKLEMFQLGLDRQTSELQLCIQNQMSLASRAVWRLHKKIKKYFRKLRSYLKSKTYRTEGWETVRAEVLTHLQRLDMRANRKH